MRREIHVARMEETRNLCDIFVEKRNVKRQLRESRSRWKDNIKIYLQGKLCEDMY